jgi:uncharacterized membrane protein
MRHLLVQAFLFLHVLGAIVAVGPSLTYSLWRARAESAGTEQRLFVLRTISFLDGRVATPAFGLQAVTGTALVLLNHLSFLHTAWLLLGVSIYVVTAIFAAIVYVPVVRRQRALAERLATSPEDSAIRREYAAAARTARRYGLAAMLLTIAILFLMIVQPALWSPA